MWTYIARRLLYAVPILIGVLFLTFLLFFAISSPEDLARSQLQKGANNDSIARWMRDQGYATYTASGLEKLAKAPELERLSKAQSERGEDARQLTADSEGLRKAHGPTEAALAPAKLVEVKRLLGALGTLDAAKEATAALGKIEGRLTQANTLPVLEPLVAALEAVEPRTPVIEGTLAAVASLRAALPDAKLAGRLELIDTLPEVKKAKEADAASEAVAAPFEAMKAEAKKAADALGEKIKAVSGDKEKKIDPDLVAKARLEAELARTKAEYAKKIAPLSDAATEAALAAQLAWLDADRAKLAAMREAAPDFTDADGVQDPVFATLLAELEARRGVAHGGKTLAEYDYAVARAEHDAHLLQGQVQGLIITAEDTQRHGLIRLFVTYVRDLFTFNFGQNNAQRPVSEVLLSGMGPSLKLMIPAFLLTEIIAVTLALFAALYRGTRIDRSLVVMSVFLMSFSSIAMTMFIQKVVAADWGYFPIAGYASGLPGYAFLILPMFIYVIISLGTQMRFNRILMLDEIGQDYVRTARAKGLGQNAILFRHVLRNTLIPLITRWAVVIPNLYLGSLVLESFFGIPGLGGITVQAIAIRDVNTIRALVFIGTIIYILATLLADVLYAVVDPRVKLK